MPSVFTLEGSHEHLAATTDDNLLLRWLHTQSPIVAVGVGLGLAVIVGLTLTRVATWGLDKAKGSI